MATQKVRQRRRYDAEFKAQVVAQCEVPGASVAQVAMANGINANIVHGWRKLMRVSMRSVHVITNPLVASRAPSAPSFIAVPLPAPASAPCALIHIELKRGATSVNITWPTSSADGCAAWLRELLR